MDTIKEDLLKALECPVCFEYMLPPITMCSNGHNICSTCKPSLRSCPTCRGDFLDVRNKCVEHFSSTIEHPCKFQKSGCNRKFLLGPKEQHEGVCRYGTYKCPYHIITGIVCPWKGTSETIKRHIESIHKDDYIPRITMNGKKSTRLQNYIKWINNGLWYQAVFTQEKTFFLYCKIIDKNLHMCFMYVASREDNNNCKYTISIKSSDGKQRASLQLPCPNYLDFFDGEFPYEKCATFYKDFTKLCIDMEGDLPFEFEISQD